MGGIFRHFVSQLSIFQVELKYLSTVRRIHRNKYSTSTSMHEDTGTGKSKRANLGPAGRTSECSHMATTKTTTTTMTTTTMTTTARTILS